MVNAFEWCRDKTDSTLGHTDDDYGISEWGTEQPHLTYHRNKDSGVQR
jgi:hypothetical protein